jgi:hypothetical protein
MKQTNLSSIHRDGTVQQPCTRPDSHDYLDPGTRKKKKRKSEMALGIALMENFTSKNVAYGRLTVRSHFCECSIDGLTECAVATTQSRRSVQQGESECEGEDQEMWERESTPWFVSSLASAFAP